MEYVFFAGANGSGKSTLIKKFRSLEEYQGFRYICADEIESELTKINLSKEEKMKRANFLAKEFRSKFISIGEDIIYESVASHPSHLDDLKAIKDAGYKITLFYVTTETPQINIERIKKRGRDNDTYLTPERVSGRYQRSLDLLFDMIEISDISYIFDNSLYYLAIFYKECQQHYLLNKTNWTDDYILKKMKEKNIEVLEAEKDSELKNRINQLFKNFTE